MKIKPTYVTFEQTDEIWKDIIGYEILSNMQQECLGQMKEGQLASKKSGLRLAKEEIRRNIKELEQQLNDL